MEQLSFDEAKNIVEKHFLPNKCICSTEDHENSISIKIFYNNQDENDFYLTKPYIRYRNKDDLAWFMRSTKFDFQQKKDDRLRHSINE